MRTELTIVDRVGDFFKRFLVLPRHELYRVTVTFVSGRSFNLCGVGGL
jgi:hypothetical protein